MSASNFKDQNTPQSEDAEIGEDQPCRLLELPTELRLMIWENLFSSMAKYTNQQQISYLTAIIYANKSIFHETAPILIKYKSVFLERLLKQLHKAHILRSPRKDPKSKNVAKKVEGCKDRLKLVYKMFLAIKGRMDMMDASDAENATGEHLKTDSD